MFTKLAIIVFFLFSSTGLVVAILSVYTLECVCVFGVYFVLGIARSNGGTKNQRSGRVNFARDNPRAV